MAAERISKFGFFTVELPEDRFKDPVNSPAMSCTTGPDPNEHRFRELLAVYCERGIVRRIEPCEFHVFGKLQILVLCFILGIPFFLGV